MRKFWRYLGIGILAVFLASLIGFILWAAIPAQPEVQALNSLASDQYVQYQTSNNWLVFQPNGGEAESGLILYPGGRVDYRAYAPAAREIASSGYIVVVVPMPLNFAFFGLNRADEVIAAFPNTKYWAVGGHSLGGAMAAEFAKDNPRIEGLVLWAAYPADSTDLSQEALLVTSIYASEDGLATLEEIEASKQQLPDETIFVEIQGGNHAGFGWYGPQNGDGVAEIPKPEQQNLIVESTVELLALLNDQADNRK